MGPLSCLSGYLIIPEYGRWAREEEREGKVQDESRCDRKGKERVREIRCGSVCMTSKAFLNSNIDVFVLI